MRRLGWTGRGFAPKNGTAVIGAEKESMEVEVGDGIELRRARVHIERSYESRAGSDDRWLRNAGNVEAVPNLE